MTTNLITSVPFKKLIHEEANPVFGKFNRQLLLELEIAREEIRLLRNKISLLQVELELKSDPLQ